jgi:hypothetical protein
MFIDYTGKKNNKLTALSFIERVNNKTYWLFKCDCGNEKSLVASRVFLKDSSTKSCGCYKKEIWSRVVKKNKCKSVLITVERTKKELYFSYKGNANRRKYIFDLTYDYFIGLVNSDCFYCGIKPNRIQKCTIKKVSFPEFICNGVDRKDNTIGYIKSNCVPCCRLCNRAKNNLSYLEFMQWIKQIKNN